MSGGPDEPKKAAPLGYTNLVRLLRSFWDVRDGIALPVDDCETAHREAVGALRAKRALQHVLLQRL